MRPSKQVDETAPLVRIYRFFQKHGWLRGEYHDPAKNCFCMRGAAMELGIDSIEVHRAMNKAKPVGWSGPFPTIVNWNDTRKSKTQFMLQLRKAAGL